MRRAADVHALGAREEHDLPARLPEPVAPVRLLAEEEVVLVEEADLVDRLATNEHARAHHDLAIAHLVVVEATRVERVERPRSRRELAQEEVLGREPPQRREPAHRALQRPVRVQQARPERRPHGATRPANSTRRSSASPTSQASAFRMRTYRLSVSRMPDVPAGTETTVLRLDHADLREPLANEARPCRRASRCRRRASRRRDAREALLDPGQRVVRDDDDRDVLVTHARPAAACLRGRPPRRMMAPPGSASTTVTRKKRNPAANAWSAPTPRLPRKLTKNASRTASPFKRERDEHDEEEQRPHHVVDAHVEVDPDGLRATAQIERMRTACTASVTARTATEEARRPAIVVDALVERPRTIALEPEPVEERLRAAEQRARRAREEEEREDEGPEDEHALEPEVRAHVVVADREDEADRAEEHRRGASEPALEHHGPGDDGDSPRVPAHGLDDPDGIAAERSREHLAGRVRDEVRAREPREPLVDPVRAEEPAPAQREDRHREHHDRHREGEPAEARPRRGCRASSRARSSRRGRRSRPRSGRASRRAACYGSRAAPGATSSVRSSNAMFAAATAVGCPRPSYGGLTSTTSYPEKRRPRRARR